MPHTRIALILTLLWALPAWAAPAKSADKPLLETWQAAYYEGLKVGHLHTVSRQVGEGAARIRTARSMHLTIKRYGGVVPIEIEQVCDEKADGSVIALTESHKIGGTGKTFSGQVEGRQINVSVGGDARAMPWDNTAYGLYAQDVIFQKRKVKPGDKVRIVSYELMLGGTITIDATVKTSEKVDQLALRKDADGKEKITRVPATLLRVETVPQPVVVGGTKVQLPKKVVWLDGKMLPSREEFEMPGLGVITLYTTTKDAALKEGVAPERLPDFGLNINIPLRQTIDDPYKTTEAVYRVTLKEKLDKVFAEDARQQVRNAKETSFELVVQAVRGPGEDSKAGSPGKEFLQSNTFIDSDDARIQARAKAVAGGETDPWRKALLLEKWVYLNMKPDASVGFPSASQIARDLKGDCRQHALLLAALCRAAGVPSRTAVGLIYVRERGRSPFFGFHMWVEVWAGGRWVGLDAILGEGGVAATHLKMGDHSWGKTQTLAPLLPIAQTLGKLQIDVVSSK